MFGIRVHMREAAAVASKGEKKTFRTWRKWEQETASGHAPVVVSKWRHTRNATRPDAILFDMIAMIDA